MTERALSFSLGAEQYAAARPGYPQAVVDWAIPDGARTVLDLGAGTGKLTAGLAARGHDVVAVEPSHEMLAQLTAELPGVLALPGTAEAIPLPDASVDAVTVGQAWHWFDPVRASREIARVLRPGGRLTVMWNVRDESEPWVAAYTAILHRDDPTPPGSEEPTFGDLFTEPEAFEARWSQPLGPGGLRALAGTRSFLLTMHEDERAARLGEVDALVAGHPALVGHDELRMPYVTQAWRATLR